MNFYDRFFKDVHRMKKGIAFLLILALMLSLAACGGQNSPETTAATSAQTDAATVATDATTVPDETEPTTEPVAETPAFDIGWAGDEHLMPIPEPPITQFSVSTNHYSDCLQFYISGTDKDEVKALTEADIAAYCALLKDCGFTKVEKELEFNTDNCMFTAYTEDESAKVVVDCYLSIGGITIYAKQNISQG